MTEAPPFSDWGFPSWLRCYCENAEGFEHAKHILREYGFVDSPFERGAYDQALVLPRPDVRLEEEFARKDGDRGFGWGIGRAKFHKEPPQVEFKYFPDQCPWEYIKDNPMREAVIGICNFLKPVKFADRWRKNEIPFPY